jgi:hypothetical protein
MANLLMRTGLGRSELIACVLHPHSGIVLQLHWRDWIADEWSEYIPWGIWSDFIYRDHESPGPNGTLLDGLLRPVFFVRSEYHEWLAKKFGASVKINELFPTATNPRGLRVVDAVIEAVKSLWGKSPPAGLGAKQRDHEINQWLRANGRRTATASTIRRAFAIKRAERT